MRWPWVSRLAFDVVTQDRDAWKGLALSQTEHVRRYERVGVGAPEIAPQPRKPIEPMPPEVRDRIDSFGSPLVRQDLQNRYTKARLVLGSWDAVIAQIEMEIADEEAMND